MPLLDPCSTFYVIKRFKSREFPHSVASYLFEIFTMIFCCVHFFRPPLLTTFIWFVTRKRQKRIHTYILKTLGITHTSLEKKLRTFVKKKPHNKPNYVIIFSNND